ncbi:MAG: hypothetical protein IIZ78_00705 [Clostridiales bacterium]|nr:hypothetical protein [Clostridiales bacterium]
MGARINSQGMRAMIRRAYAEDKRVADDDVLLLCNIYKACGWDNKRTLLANLRKMPSPETIRRTRQRLVSEGLIIPSLSATERRYKNFKKARKDLEYELF